jgi:hypothetical protein
VLSTGILSLGKRRVLLASKTQYKSKNLASRGDCMWKAQACAFLNISYIGHLSNAG